MKVEQHYQCELKALSESLIEQRLHWQAQLQKTLENAEEQRRMMEESLERERESQEDVWTKKRRELENAHNEEMEELIMKNKQLQNELDDIVTMTQTKEIELSRQLNDLHNRLHESLESKDELLALSENKVLEIELLLNQTVDDFKQERAEFLRCRSEHEANYNEVLLISEKQATERTELLTEQDNLKMEVEELEILLTKVAVDFEFERNELQEHIFMFERKLQDGVECGKEVLITEREENRKRIKELETKQNQVLASKEKMNGLNIMVDCVQNTTKAVLFSGEEETFLEVFPCSNKISQMKSMEAVKAGFRNITNVETPYISDEQTEVKMVVIENQEQDHRIVVSENCAFPENVIGVQAGFENQADALSSYQIGCSSPEIYEKDCECDPDIESKAEYISTDMQCVSSSFEGVDAHELGKNKIVLGSCVEENRPEDLTFVETESLSQEDEQSHKAAVDPPAPKEKDDICELSITCLPSISCDHKQEVDLHYNNLTTILKETHTNCAQGKLEHPDDVHWEGCSLLKPQTMYNTFTENILLHEKIALLQQKIEILESLLADNSKKIKTGHQVLEESFSLKVKMLLLIEHVKDLEIKALKMTDLEIRYEECMCENANLKDQNDDLKKRVWSLESRMNFFHIQQDSFVNEVCIMREQNAKLSKFLQEGKSRNEIFLDLNPGTEQLESLNEEDLLEQFTQVEVKPMCDLEDCCTEFEKKNTELRRAITELQDDSHTLDQTTQAHR